MPPARFSRHGDPRRRRSSRSGQSGGGRGLWLYGRHAVLAALANPRRDVERLLGTAEFQQRFGSSLPKRNQVETVDRSMLDELLGPSAVHQGIAAKVRPLPLLGLEELIDLLPAEAPAQIVVLDEVTDPRNVGAVMRSAAGFGAAGLVAEGRGLRRLTAETCDSLVAIPISDAMESLNVSNAAAVALYEWVRAHGLPSAATPAK